MERVPRGGPRASPLRPCTEATAPSSLPGRLPAPGLPDGAAVRLAGARLAGVRLCYLV